MNNIKCNLNNYLITFLCRIIAMGNQWRRDISYIAQAANKIFLAILCVKFCHEFTLYLQEPWITQEQNFDTF